MDGCGLRTTYVGGCHFGGLVVVRDDFCGCLVVGMTMRMRSSEDEETSCRVVEIEEVEESREEDGLEEVKGCLDTERA